MVRIRQVVHNLAGGLLFVPLTFIVGAVVVAQTMTTIDGRLEDSLIPTSLTTSVDGGRSILSAIAGGLISSVTLLLSLVLVAVQLASSQFSPRTLRGWTSNRTQQIAIGLVLGTAVYCLLILRETRRLTDQQALAPHLSILLAVTLGVLSLIAVLRSVDALTKSLRVGSVAQSITDETVAVIRRRADRLYLQQPAQQVAAPPEAESTMHAIGDGLALPSPRSGWVQQIDEERLLSAVPDKSTVRLVAPIGAFVMKESPLAWVDPIPDDKEARSQCLERAADAYAIGDERTLQEDVGYGIVQLTDVALRALSPGINDPNTANDIIVSLGVVLLTIWEYPTESTTVHVDDRTLVRRLVTHGEFLERAIDPIRRHGADDASVVSTILTTLAAVKSETQRRNLPGPISPIHETVDRVLATFHRSDPDPRDVEIVENLAAELFSDSVE